MASEGPLSPGTMASDAMGESERVNSWGTPDNAKTSNDTYTSSFAFYDTGGPTNDKTQYLIATNFGFSRVSGDTIDGIQCEVECNTDNTSGVSLTTRLLRTGTFYGAYQFPTIPFNEPSYSSVGGGSNLLDFNEGWSEINDSTFGFGTEVSADSGPDPNSSSPNIDHVRLTVYYTPAATGGHDLLLLGVGA